MICLSRAAVGAMFIVLIGVHCAGRNWIFNTFLDHPSIGAIGVFGPANLRQGQGRVLCTKIGGVIVQITLNLFDGSHW